MAALAEEIGRAACPSPLETTLFATFVLREAGTAAAREWLGEIVAGSAATLAITNARFRSPWECRIGAS